MKTCLLVFNSGYARVNLPFLPTILMQKLAGNVPICPCLGTMHFSLYVDIAGLYGSSQFTSLALNEEQV